LSRTLSGRTWMRAGASLNGEEVWAEALRPPARAAATTQHCIARRRAELIRGSDKRATSSKLWTSDSSSTTGLGEQYRRRFLYTTAEPEKFQADGTPRRLQRAPTQVGGNAPAFSTRATRREGAPTPLPLSPPAFPVTPPGLVVTPSVLAITPLRLAGSPP